MGFLLRVGGWVHTYLLFLLSFFFVGPFFFGVYCFFVFGWFESVVDRARTTAFPQKYFVAGFASYLPEGDGPLFVRWLTPSLGDETPG